MAILSLHQLTFVAPFLGLLLGCEGQMQPQILSLRINLQTLVLLSL